MDASTVSPSPNFNTAQAQVMTNVEKNDKAQAPVKPVSAGAKSTSATLGEKELHRQQAAEAKKNETAKDFEAMSEIAEEIQDRLDMMGSTLGFSINKKYETIVAQISNRSSGEIIKEFPSEEVLELREKLQELVGLFFDKKV